MSRVVYLDMSEKAVIAHCDAKSIGISCLGKGPSGGIRLVCSSVDGATRLRRDLKTRLTKNDIPPEQHGPGWGFVPRA